MIKNERQSLIMSYLEAHGTVSVSDLANSLGFSMMTIRRDLDELEQDSLIKKVHGGAILLQNDSVQPNFYKRIIENTEEKNKIAYAAAALIKQGNIVFFDAGTTSHTIAKFIPEHLSFTAITNCIMTGAELCSKPNVNVILLGGELHHSSYSTINNVALSQVSNYHADLALISTKAFSYPEGIFETLLPLIEIKKAFVRSAEKTTLVLDYTKFQSKSLCLSIPLNDIDEIITDNKAPSDVLENLKNMGKSVIVV